jgi:hypothetical protein
MDGGTSHKSGRVRIATGGTTRTTRKTLKKEERNNQINESKREREVKK